MFAALAWRPTEAQRMLASLAHTRAQLRAALFGLADEQLDQQPAPGEWSVREALRHIINNEQRFALDAVYAVERLSGNGSRPVERPAEERGPGTLGAELPGNLGEVMQTLDSVREQVITATVDLDEPGLAAATTWGNREVTVGFMVFRRAMHERQHLVQIQKTLQQIGFRQGEALLLLGQAAIARGTLEGALIGVPDNLLDRTPDGRPSVRELLEEAMAQEQASLASVLKAAA